MTRLRYDATNLGLGALAVVMQLGQDYSCFRFHQNMQPLKSTHHIVLAHFGVQLRHSACQQKQRQSNA